MVMMRPGWKYLKWLVPTIVEDDSFNFLGLPPFLPFSRDAAERFV
jgi:hypothetical protein